MQPGSSCAALLQRGENTPARAQRPRICSCGAEPRAKLISADGGVNAFAGERQGRAGAGCAPAGVGGSASPPPWYFWPGEQREGCAGWKSGHSRLAA